MKFIYLDNFRGFSDTLVPINSVNFLIGENSTGKSSLLSLIYLLSSPEFWHRQDFNILETNLGTWSDIVSAESGKLKEFTVGEGNYSNDETTESKSREKNFAYLITYREKEGLPHPYRFRLLWGTKWWDFFLTGNGIKYTVGSVASSGDKRESALKFFQNWRLKNRSRLNGSYKHIPYRNSNLPLYLLPFLVNVSTKDSPDAEDITLPIHSRRIKWIAPIRAKPKRTYETQGVSYSPEGDHIPHLLARSLEEKNTEYSNKGYLAALKKFGAESGLYRNISVKKYNKNQSDSPFKLNIQINNSQLSLDNVGYGVSQSLPIVVELLSGDIGDWYSVQQPEVHLHPKAQAAVGDLFFEVASKMKSTLLVETHSDYLIDRYRLRMSKATDQPTVSSQVIFFSREGGTNKVTSIPIDEGGHYSEEQPPEFRLFFLQEQFKMLEVGI